MLRLISRFLRYFRRLRWKLTASYTFVTVAALVAIELLLMLVVAGIIVFFLGQSPDIVMTELETDLAPDLRPALLGPSPDLAAIDTRLEDIRLNGFDTQDSGINVTLSREELEETNTDILVLDSQTRLLGSLQQDTPPAQPTPFDISSVSGLDDTLPEALTGQSSHTPFPTWPIASRLTIATPIKAGDGSVLGAVVFTSQIPPVALPVREIIVAFIASAVFFTVAAGTIGTIFGYFTARGLTRRLDRVTSTAAAWGTGDFSRTIKDSSADEIGQLARQLNRMAEQLAELIQTREQLSVADERNRLARDLHDSVKQQAFAISMNLAAAQAIWERDPEAARQRLDAAYELARQSQQELTTIIQTLRPAQLESKGIRQALTDYVDRWRDQTSIEARLEIDGESTPPREVEDALFRVTQEALANVARHSSATKTSISLKLTPDAAQLTVRDDGQGFDTRRQRSGVGLHSMRERIEAVGGSFSIESGSEGTTISARVPLANGD